MSVVTERLPGGAGSEDSRPRAVLGALGITVVALVAGIVAIVAARTVLAVLGVGDGPVIELFQSHFIQLGFAAFAVGYLLWSRDWDRYVRVRWPTLEDVAWVFAIPLLFAAMGMLTHVLASAVGLTADAASGGGSLALETMPLLWPVAFVWLFLFAAPAEELVYRGLVQGRLRGAFDTAGVVLLGGLLFGFMHFLVGLISGAGLDGSLVWALYTGGGGLIWAYVYERTENLAVTAVSHAMSWTVNPYEVILQVVSL